MVTRTNEAPQSGRPEVVDLLRRAGEMAGGGANMRNGYLELYWDCQIWRRSHGVYDIKCLRSEKEGDFYGRLDHLKARIRTHIKRHTAVRNAPCRLAEDLRSKVGRSYRHGEDRHQPPQLPQMRPAQPPIDAVSCDCGFDFDHKGLQPQYVGPTADEANPTWFTWKGLLLSFIVAGIMRAFFHNTVLGDSMAGNILAFGLSMLVGGFTWWAMHQLLSKKGK